MSNLTERHAVFGNTTPRTQAGIPKPTNQGEIPMTDFQPGVATKVSAPVSITDRLTAMIELQITLTMRARLIGDRMFGPGNAPDQEEATPPVHIDGQVDVLFRALQDMDGELKRLEQI